MAEIPALENKVFCTTFYHLPLNLHLNIKSSLLIPLQNILYQIHIVLVDHSLLYSLETRMQTEPLENSGSFKKQI